MKFSKKVELTLALAPISACGAMTGCHALTPAEQVKLDRVDCYTHALWLMAPADAELAAKDLADGVVSFEDIVSITTAAESTVVTVREQVALCNAAHPMPAKTASADAGTGI